MNCKSLITLNVNVGGAPVVQVHKDFKQWYTQTEYDLN